MPSAPPPPTRLLRAAASIALALLAALVPLACGPEPAPPAPANAFRGYDADGRALGTPPAPRRTPNIILVLLDTLRADALSIGRPERGVMPRLAAWAAQGAAFENAVAPASWTMPSVVSLLTGLLPGEHLQSAAVVPPPSTAPLTSFGEILAATYGYHGAAFVGLPDNEGPRNMFPGFEKVEGPFQLQAVPDVLPRWAAERPKDRPFFLVLHTYEAHDPYGEANHPYPPLRGKQVPAEELAALGPDPDPALLARRMLTDALFRNALRDRSRRETWMPRVVEFLFDGLKRNPDPVMAEALKRAYLEGAAWLDGLVERTFQELERLGLTKDTLIIVAADHGEAFGEHGALQHQRWLYDELVRVPLLMRGPPPFDRPRVVRGQVALHDVFPTVFEWAGMPVPAGLDGRSFLPLLEQDGPGRVVISEEVRTPQITSGRSRAILVSARTLGWKYILTHELLTDEVTEELYHLERDPGEEVNKMLSAAAAPSLPPELVAAIEDARERVYTPERRLISGTRPPAARRRPPFHAQRPEER